MRGKAAYLSRLTSRFRFRSVELGENLQGSTPPSLFIGKHGYPKVSVGPMLAQQQGDTSLLDTPERWMENCQSAQNIIEFRLQLVRGKNTVGIRELDNRLVCQLQEIALSDKSMDAEASFAGRPRGFSFSEEHQPFGPSAQLKNFSIGSAPWQPQLEKVFYDTDMRAADAVTGLYSKGMLFSQIQKAFSAGAMGLGKNRRLVPTRWSITAVDDILGKHLLESVKQSPLIENYQLYEHAAFNNYFAILLLPTAWQYEWMEAFIRVLGSEEVIFSDRESFEGKKEYSCCGGCYYSVRMAIAEFLARSSQQAGALVFREAYPGYVPLGVWQCRENARAALEKKPAGFISLRGALSNIFGKLRLPARRWVAAGRLLEKEMRAAPAENIPARKNTTPLKSMGDNCL